MLVGIMKSLLWESHHFTQPVFKTSLCQMKGVSFDLCQWLQLGGPAKNKWAIPTIGWIPYKFNDELCISLANTQ